MRHILRQGRQQHVSKNIEEGAVVQSLATVRGWRSHAQDRAQAQEASADGEACRCSLLPVPYLRGTSDAGRSAE